MQHVLTRKQLTFYKGSAALYPCIESCAIIFLSFQMGQCISVLLQHEYLLESDCEVINSIFLLCQMCQPQELNPFNRIIFNYVNQKPVTSKYVIFTSSVNLLVA